MAYTNMTLAWQKRCHGQQTGKHREKKIEPTLCWGSSTSICRPFTAKDPRLSFENRSRSYTPPPTKTTTQNKKTPKPKTTKPQHPTKTTNQTTKPTKTRATPE